MTGMYASRGAGVHEKFGAVFAAARLHAARPRLFCLRLDRAARHPPAMRIRVSLTLALLLVVAGTALAAPRRIILLRHGEKDGGFAPSAIGQLRAEALVHQFLGQDAAMSLFRSRERPAGILSITLHTIELISGVASSWGLPQVSYSVVPGSQAGTLDDVELNRRTQEAHRDLMRNRAYRRRTVVLCWEHKHIANAELEQQYPDERVTWRQLLRLDELPDGQGALVPTTWPDDNYDYFWIIELDAKGRPKRFESTLQAFTPPYDVLPTNLWGQPK